MSVGAKLYTLAPQVIVREPKINRRLISIPATTSRIVQISAGFFHAALVTETEQVFTFGTNACCCCGLGAIDEHISRPIHVTALESISWQQVTTGNHFTVALTRIGDIYSWGWNQHGQLGRGNTQDKFRPRKIEQFDGSDPVVQVEAGVSHVLAVTKLAGRLLTWGSSGVLGHHDTTAFATSCGPNELSLAALL